MQRCEWMYICNANEEQFLRLNFIYLHQNKVLLPKDLMIMVKTNERFEHVHKVHNTRILEALFDEIYKKSGIVMY
jgi:hypothetical protein